MSRVWRYFCLQLKRFFKLMPVVLILSALLMLAAGIAFFGMFADGDKDEQDSLINIGIVGNPEDSYLGLAINALTSMDSSRFTLAIQTVDDEDKAADMIRRGDLVAYVVIPDDFITEAFYGNVQKITCVTASGAADFGSQITNELMQTVTEIVKNSQKSVYGFHLAAKAHGINGNKVYDMGNDVAIDVVEMIFERESAYDINEIGTSGVRSVPDPLANGMLVLLLMLWGITCCTVFAARSNTLNRVLSSKGTGALAQVIGEYASYLVFMTATAALFALVIFAVSPFFPKMEVLDKYDFSNLIPGMILPIVTISAMQFFLYELSGGLVSGALLQFFCAMGIGYISGCVYPAHLFPREVQDAASFLPAWSCRLWLDELLADKPSAHTFLILAAYFAAFMVLSVVIRRARIRREGGAS